MTITEMPLTTPVGGSTANVGPKVRIIPAYSIIEKPVARHTTDATLAHVQAMRELAALSFETDSLDRESDVDIWGFHSAE